MKRILLLSLSLLTACQHTDSPIIEPLPEPAPLVLGVNLGPTYDTSKAENLMAVSLAWRLKPDASGSNYVGVLGGRVVGAQWAAQSNSPALAEHKKPLAQAAACAGASGLMTDVPGVLVASTGLVNYPDTPGGVLLLKVVDTQGTDTQLWWSSGQGSFRGPPQCGPDTVVTDITLTVGWNGLQSEQTSPNNFRWFSVPLIGATLVPEEAQFGAQSAQDPSGPDWRAATATWR